jgi:hypothetical protein
MDSIQFHQGLPCPTLLCPTTPLDTPCCTLMLILNMSWLVAWLSIYMYILCASKNTGNSCQMGAEHPKTLNWDPSYSRKNNPNTRPKLTKQQNHKCNWQYVNKTKNYNALPSFFWKWDWGKEGRESPETPLIHSTASTPFMWRVARHEKNQTGSLRGLNLEIKLVCLISCAIPVLWPRGKPSPE